MRRVLSISIESLKYQMLMKGCGETVTDHNIVSKIMRTLSYKFDAIAVAIEESKDLSTMKVEELQYSLEAHEQRVNER
jgi:hypothetical protein